MITREEMIDRQLKARNITDEGVLKAMSETERELFVPDDVLPYVYDDGPLPIGKKQTISQPYIVAYMVQTLQLQPQDTVLEIGSGSGYNAAIMARIACHVYSIEIVEWLARYARKNLDTAGITNVSIRYGDGYKGWPEKAPFDKIILTASAPDIPKPLKKQLKVGGLLLAPVGERLVLLEKRAEKDFKESLLLGVRFVPMTGEVQTVLH